MTIVGWKRFVLAQARAPLLFLCFARGFRFFACLFLLPHDFAISRFSPKCIDLILAPRFIAHEIDLTPDLYLMGGYPRPAHITALDKLFIFHGFPPLLASYHHSFTRCCARKNQG